jgi:hypothetical protein
MKRLCILIAFALASCGGGSAPAGGNLVPATVPQAQKAQNASIVIHIPAPATSSSSARPAYVSASTKSIAIALTPNAGCSGCSAASTVNQNLTPASPGCTTTSGATTCTIALLLNPGAYTANVTTYDATGETGNVLSSNQAVAVTITVNSANLIPMVLNGIPASTSLSVVNSPSGALIKGIGSAVNPATIYVDAGASATLLVTPLDADGNAIVGAGAPTVTVAGTSSGQTGFTATANASADTIALAVPSITLSYGAQRLSVDAQLAGPGCSGSNPACGLIYFYVYQTPLVAVSDYGGTTPKVQIYNTRTQAFTQNTYAGFSMPSAIAFDTNANMFVADPGNNKVFEFAPPYTGTPIATITTGINGPAGQNAIALDASGDLFVSNNSNNNITEYKPPYSSLFQTFSTDIANPLGVFLDTEQDLWILSDGNGSVLYYPAGFTSATAPTIDAVGQPVAIEQSASAPLYIIDLSTTQAAVFYQSGAYSGSGYPIDTGSTYIAAVGTSSVSSSPSMGRLVGIGNTPPTYLTGYVTPRGLAGDAVGNLFIADSGKPTVWELTPSLTGSPISIGGTWDFPSFVAVWPFTQ